jgi:hypothetical protein
MSAGKSLWVLINLSSTADAEFVVPVNLRGARIDQVTGKEIELGERVSLPAAGVMIF